MFGVGTVEVLVLLALVVLVVMGLLWLGRTRVAGADGEVSREWRLVLATRSTAVVVGLVLAVVTFLVGSAGRGPMLSLAVFGLCVLLGTALGETVVRPRLEGGVRSASLTPRRIRDYLPPVTTILVSAMVTATAATLLLTTVTASRDGHGHFRQLACSTPSFGSSRGPYPGSYYSLPLTVVLVLVLLAAGYAARQVVRRPRGMARTEAGEDLLRSRSLDVIVAATGLAVAAPLFGVALTAGGAMRTLATQQPSCAAPWMGSVGVLMLLLSLVALLTTLVCIGRLLSPVRVHVVAADQHVGS